MSLGYRNFIINIVHYLSFLTIAIVLQMSLLSCKGATHDKSVVSYKDQITHKNLVPYKKLGRVDGNRIIVESDFDLGGGECYLPDKSELEFKDAVLKNGTLVGNNTTIKCNGAAFNGINIKGEWNVPIISSTMFSNVHGENQLKNVFALANPNIKNTIHIEKGDYTLCAFSENDRCVIICSNTEVIMNGRITLRPNGLKRCDIIYVNGSNISLKGNGSIIGDALTHTGTGGEWGMGIRIAESNNVLIQGLTISDCWGDCIYIGSNSKDVVINNCILAHGRRQGISITSANGVTIKKCKIRDISGTSPEFGIDIEPNKGGVVENVLVEQVNINNCIGGILAYGEAEKSRIGKIDIRDCYVEGIKEPALSFMKCASVLLHNNKVTQTSGKQAIFCRGIRNVRMEKNIVQCRQGVIKDKSKGYTILECDTFVIQNNKAKSF